MPTFIHKQMHLNESFPFESELKAEVRAVSVTNQVKKLEGCSELWKWNQEYHFLSQVNIGSDGKHILKNVFCKIKYQTKVLK